MAVRKQVTRNKKQVTSKIAGMRLELTQIFRKITAIASWRVIIVILIVSLLALNLIRFGQNLYSNYQEAQVKQAQKRAIEAEITKWRQVVQEKPNYRDAYFELAVLSFRLNQIEETKRYLNKVFEFDPNFEPARELEKKINP